MSSSFQQSNKRIVKNTAFMYLKLIVTILVGLYTSRVVLQVLGTSDFGLFNVVGGILAMFTVFSDSLGVATTRFLNVEMGKENGNLRTSFNINLILHFFIAISIVVLAEIIGLYYINNYLNVSPGKEEDAHFIFHVAVLTAFVGIVGTPYKGLFNAKEKFNLIAILEIINVIIRLILVITLKFSDGNNLKLYSIFIGFTTIDIFIFYIFYSHKKWEETVRWKFVREWQSYKSVLLFNNWNLLSTTSMMARSSGCDLLINYFFGTITNGAYAISKAINQYLISFAVNFEAASTPQIIQAYSSGANDRCTYLVNKLGRFNLLLFELMFFPLFVDMDFILRIWLGDVPEGTVLFCRLNLILAFVSLTGGGIVQYINASGKLKWFSTIFSILFLICIPLGYVLFQLGFASQTILILFIIADLLFRVIQLFLLRFLLNFDSYSYVKKAYSRPMIVLAFMTLVMYCLSQIFLEGILFSVIKILATLVLTLVVIFSVGLEKSERQAFLTYVKNKL